MEESPVQDQPPEIQSRPAKPWLRIALFLALGVILVGGLVFAALKIGIPTKPRERACTTEAKICPDGSAVGRVGPNCEFAPCPTQAIQDETANWKTYTNEKYGYLFKCPPTSTHNVEVDDGNGVTIPLVQEICFESTNQVRIMVQNAENGLPSQEILKEILSGTSSSPNDYSDSILGNHPEIKYSIQNTSGRIEANVAEILLDQKKEIFIRGFDKKYFDQILSTFRFLE